MRVLIPVANRFIRPNNTDWRIAAELLPTMSEYFSDFQLVIQDNRWVDLRANWGKLISIARAKGAKLLPHGWEYFLEEDCPVFQSDIAKAQADAILSYERYPAKNFGRPVAWITSPTYLDVMRKQGFTEREIQRVLAWKKSRAARPDKLIFITQVALDNFVRQNGEEHRSRSVVIPCLIRGLSPLPESAVEEKWRSGPIRLLFVGREATRKGLPATLRAVTPLLQKDPQLQFTIVSSMSDGPIDIPSLPNIKVLSGISREELMRHMAEAHFLLMPSWFENYGFVYVEAMSQGCIPLALESPIQRELIGSYGLLTKSQDPEEIRETLKTEIASRDQAAQKGIGALDEYNRKHAPAVIAAQFRDVFQSIKRS